MGDAPIQSADRPAASGVAMAVNEAFAAGSEPLHAAVDLQHGLLMAASDLDRLQSLLGAATDALLSGICDAVTQLRGTPEGAGPAHAGVQQALAQLEHAAPALQFHDMAAQLIDHIQQRLRHCTDRLACQAFGNDADNSGATAAPLRSSPVAQGGMAAGSIELF